MSEEWKKEFFEWKDEIEGKFNSLSLKISNPEWLDVLILDLMKPQLAELHAITDAQVIINKYHSTMFNRLEDILRELGKRLEKWFIESCEKYIVGDIPKILEKLDPKSIHNDPILKECQEKFKEMEKQTEKKDSELVVDHNTGIITTKRVMDKLKASGGEKSVMSKALDDLDEIYCIHCGKPKEKLPEPEKFPKVVYQLGSDSKEYIALKKKYDELIEGVQDKLEFLRDKVLEAPILSGSVQDLRDHIHDLKDLVVKSIEEYEGMLK